VLAEELFRLDPNATRTINLRDLAALAAGPDGFARGFVVVESDRPTSTDYFYVTPGEDFATGGRLTNDVCRGWDLRFFDGGIFSGGTPVQIFVNNPLGANPQTDLRSAVIAVYSEGGQLFGTMNLFTADPALELTAREILDRIPGSPPAFGALEIGFTEPAERGWVQGSFSAENRYSVGLVGSCIDEF
jgi:hypothetical protein